MSRVLVVNADDYGRTEGVNRGIIEAHERGIVTSASLMVRWPAAREAAAYVRGGWRLGLGLHVDLGEWVFRGGRSQHLVSRGDHVAQKIAAKIEQRTIEPADDENFFCAAPAHITFGRSSSAMTLR